ncbi:response regulator, partial [Mycobacterium avium]|uniref:response regulator n=1 Tax=Mycobacterium avium TaxID=1764 RepID=UPI00191C8076
PVKLSAAFLALLGLPDTATEEQAMSAASQLKTTAQAANTEQPNLAQFVPRADYDALVGRATNAEQALELAGADAKGFDAVFSDVVMPGITGVALARELRRRRPGLPVVLTS